MGYSYDIVTTSKFLEKLAKDNDNSVDQDFVLRSRLFDIWISDWDRHDDQWRWATFKSKKGDEFRPIPRDRDQAFFLNEGIIPKFYSRRWALPKFEGFDDDVNWPSGLSYNARYFDRFFLTEPNEEDWIKFKQPIMNVLDAKTGGNRILRYAYLVILPILIGGFSYNAMVPKSEEPIELRTVHPAPPASTKVHGKTYTLQTTQNPYRVNPEGKYDQEYSNANIVEQGMGRLMKPNANPWDKDAQGYLKYVREGGEIFYQNCHFCHGDNLNGRGLHAFAFNPIPANFTDPGTIAQLQETFIFWRVSKGGIGLPNEGFPWASVMPPWEQHLTVDEIWKVVLFEYWHTGYYPRTWD